MTKTFERMGGQRHIKMALGVGHTAQKRGRKMHIKAVPRVGLGAQFESGTKACPECVNGGVRS